MIDFHEILDRMNQNQRINFDKVFQRMARRWQQEGVKPRVLLHSCCGPCSTAVLDRLTGVADVTVYYFNPNIHPEAEYRRRELVQKQFIEAYNKETGHDVHFLAAPYEPETYFEAVKGLEDEPEGGARCRVCFV
ncbi:MAG: epoxyqueuosine reductase QueH, partial [Megasphaera elsdenii]|nr:epoxyqueuosine reductase QueH [Megasphaera elsdenii]